MGFPLGLPLTLALSPQAGEGGPGGACGARARLAAASTIRGGGGGLASDFGYLMNESETLD